MTDILKQYLTVRINEELTKRGIDISKVSFRFEDAKTFDDIDEFDGKPFHWTGLDSVFVTLPPGNYTNKFWMYLYRLEERLYDKTSRTPELDDENCYCIYWLTPNAADSTANEGGEIILP